MLQSYLYRTSADVERAILLKCRVRLCKGAYKEPASVAYPDKKDVDANYVAAWRLVQDRTTIPASRHDRAIIDATKRFVKEKGIAPRDSSSRCCTACGATCRSSSCARASRMRVYVPFGTQWYPYLMRRLAERPANVAFITGNVVKEMVGRNRH